MKGILSKALVWILTRQAAAADFLFGYEFFIS